MKISIFGGIIAAASQEVAQPMLQSGRSWADEMLTKRAAGEWISGGFCYITMDFLPS